MGAWAQTHVFFTFTEGMSFPPIVWVVLCTFGLSMLWHLGYAANLGKKLAATYWLKLALLASFYFFYLYTANYKQLYLHFHHWWLGFCFTCVGSHEHVISDVHFGICLGIFVNGVAAYDTDPLLEPISTYLFPPNQ